MQHHGTAAYNCIDPVAAARVKAKVNESSRVQWAGNMSIATALVCDRTHSTCMFAQHKHASKQAESKQADRNRFSGQMEKLCPNKTLKETKRDTQDAQ